MKHILPFLDLIYYDLKLMDSKEHKQNTGVDNKIIMENFEKLARDFPQLEARMPVIPTINDHMGNIMDTAMFLKRNGLKSIHLLAYHNLGEAKLSRIETNLKPMNLPTNTSDYLPSAKEMASKPCLSQK